LHIRRNAHRTARTVRGSRRIPQNRSWRKRIPDGMKQRAKIIASHTLVHRGFNMISSPPSVSLCLLGRLAPEFLSRTSAYLNKQHEILCGVFVGKIRGRYIFSPNTNKALQEECQLIHLEGAFHGAF